MQISNVASMTRDVISKQGFDGYQPTAIFPARKSVRSLAGVPETEDHEKVALRWASGLAEPGEEYFVVFRHSGAEFKVVHVEQSRQRTEVFPVKA